MDDLTVPEWTLSWRLHRAMAHAGLNIEDMAAELGVGRSTVSRWLNDHGGPPRIGYMKLWAMRCGVPLEWLRDGDVRRPGFCRGYQCSACSAGVHCFGPRCSCCNRQPEQVLGRGSLAVAA